LSLPTFIGIKPLAAILLVNPISVRDIGVALVAAIAAVLWRAPGR